MKATVKEKTLLRRKKEIQKENANYYEDWKGILLNHSRRKL